MFRASSCPSSGEQYKADNAYGVQHRPYCSRLEEKRWFGVKQDVFIGVSTCFGHHRAHHQEKSTKPTTPMVYSTGVVGFVLFS
jgi:hypothetical protein